MSRAREFADLAGSADAGGITGRSLIINGAMNVNQYGTSSTSTGHQTVDRFFNLASTDGTITQSKTALTSGSPYDEGFRNVYRLTASTASSSPAASHYLGYGYFIEAQDLAQSGWNFTSTSSNITLSFWAKSSVAGTYTANFRSQDGTQQNQSFEYTLVADTWKKIEHTFTGDSDITINNDTGRGALIYIWVYLGTDYTASDAVYDAWAAYDSSKQSQDFAQNWMTTSNATFDITGVQLEVGEATPFEHRSYADELQRCQRYYQEIHQGVQGNAVSTVLACFAYCPPTRFRAVPTISATAPIKIDFSFSHARTQSSASVTLNFASNNGAIGFRCDNFTSLTNFAHYVIRNDGGKIILDAEL